eukprot:gene11550-13647_t
MSQPAADARPSAVEEELLLASEKARGERQQQYHLQLAIFAQELANLQEEHDANAQALAAEKAGLESTRAEGEQRASALAAELQEYETTIASSSTQSPTFQSTRVSTRFELLCILDSSAFSDNFELAFIACCLHLWLLNHGLFEIFTEEEFLFGNDANVFQSTSTFETHAQSSQDDDQGAPTESTIYKSKFSAPTIRVAQEARSQRLDREARELGWDQEELKAEYDANLEKLQAQAQHCAAQALMENELRSELSAAVSGLSEDAGGLRAALQEAETSDTASASLDAAKEREEQEETELAEMRQRVAEQEAVVTQLEQQLVQRASKGSRGPSEAMRIGEMEDRLLSLKDQMAAKQLQAEQLTGDKRALELRLEQVEAQKRKIQRRSAKGSHDERRGSKTATTPRDHSSSPPKSNIELDDEKD